MIRVSLNVTEITDSPPCLGSSADLLRSKVATSQIKPSQHHSVQNADTYKIDKRRHLLCKYAANDHQKDVVVTFLRFDKDVHSQAYDIVQHCQNTLCRHAERNLSQAWTPLTNNENEGHGCDEAQAKDLPAKQRCIERLHNQETETRAAGMTIDLTSCMNRHIHVLNNHKRMTTTIACL